MDISELIVPVNENSLAGENEEYNSLYLTLDSLSTGVPSSQMGDSVIEGKDADWKQLQKNCLELWKSTRDLRVATYLTISNLVINGLSGFGDGLELIKYLLNDMWDECWPQLDEDDDFDPLERLNILSMLSPQAGAYNDPIKFILLVRGLRLVPTNSTYDLRSLMIANGELDGSETVIDLNLLNAEMSGVPTSIMVEQCDNLERVTSLLKEITEIFESHTDIYALPFAALHDELKRLKRFYDKFTSITTEDEDLDPTSESENNRETIISSSGVINIMDVKAKNRAEALMLLRKGCEYFQVAEPTSPVPLLINRALRMSDMSFMDLLQEVDSSAYERGCSIFGVTPSNNEEY